MKHKKLVKLLFFLNNKGEGMFENNKLTLKLQSIMQHRARQLYLLMSTFYMFLAYKFNINRKTNQNIRITIFDRRLAGNLRSFIERMEKEGALLEFAYFNVDANKKEYINVNSLGKVKILNAFSLKDMGWAINSDIFMTSIYAWRFRKLVKSINDKVKFIQVFHSIHLCGEPPYWFKRMSDFDKLFCSSEWMKNNFFIANGVKKSKILSTGFANTDEFIKAEQNKKEIHNKFNLNYEKKVILLAPTMSTVANECSVGNIDIFDQSFIDIAEKFAKERDIQFVIRTHPHEPLQKGITNITSSNVFYRSPKDYPNAMEQLLITDILISDISGIAVYFMALQRPIVFLGGTGNFEDKKRFLTNDTLPGYKVKTKKELFIALRELLLQPEIYKGKYSQLLQLAKYKAFGNTLDGNCSMRYLDNIRLLLGNNLV